METTRIFEVSKVYNYMGQFGQFGLNGFKRGQTHLSQLHISLDPDKLESCVQFNHCNVKVTGL